MNWKAGLSQATTVIALTCAVTVTVAVVRREFVSSGLEASAPVPSPPRVVANWEDLTLRGHRMGSATAKVLILEFADFECPACRAFTSGPLKEIRNRYPDRVAVIFRHWPLPYHRFAYPTAVASECAGEQGRFEAFHDAVYAEQDSLGLKDYWSFARDAGAPDSVAFARCLQRSPKMSSVDDDIAAATGLGSVGAPTVIVGGKLVVGPNVATLDSLVQAALTSGEGQ